jgi:hypothetical protein
LLSKNTDLHPLKIKIKPTFYSTGKTNKNSNDDPGDLSPRALTALAALASVMGLIVVGVVLWFVVIRKRGQSEQSLPLSDISPS